MLCNWKIDNKEYSGAIVCYNDPLTLEEEQDNPFHVYERNIFYVNDRCYLMFCYLIDLLYEDHKHFSGSLVYTKCDDSFHLHHNNFRIQLRFSGKETNDILVQKLYQGGNYKFNCFSKSTLPSLDCSAIRFLEVFFQPDKLADSDGYISGLNFTRYWIASIILFQSELTQVYITSMKLKKCTRRKSTVGRRLQFERRWLWVFFPLKKPRRLNNWISVMMKEEKISLLSLYNVGYMNSGFFLAKVEKDGENQILKTVGPTYETIVIYSGPESDPIISPSLSIPARLLSNIRSGWSVVYNYNFTFSFSRKADDRSHIRYGMWGDESLVNATCYPVNLFIFQGHKRSPHEPSRSNVEFDHNTGFLSKKDRLLLDSIILKYEERWVLNARDIVNTFQILGKVSNFV